MPGTYVLGAMTGLMMRLPYMLMRVGMLLMNITKCILLLPQ
ncbi:hypothetical protein [Coxiella-like endosymbiont]|nr:hypothetical protein [Coxiella-like endosymbiont]